MIPPITSFLYPILFKSKNTTGYGYDFTALHHIPDRRQDLLDVLYKSEKEKEQENTPTVIELQKKIIELQQQLIELQKEKL
jgi:hypothetical protein